MRPLPDAGSRRLNIADSALIRGHGIGKMIDGRAVLDGVDLVVSESEIVTVIGPNGAGKSMLLRILLGLVKPDRGSVVRRPAIRIGYMPQELVVDRTLPLPVRRFLELGAPAKPAAILSALEEVGASHVIDSPIQSVSGGEFQRVLLARALLRDPDLLVLDEPVQGVDVGGQEDLFRLIRRIRDDHGCGVLMVSHDLHLVMAATDTVVCLNRHVCCTGRPETVKGDPAYLALFGATAAGAIAVYAHHHDHQHDDAGRVKPLDPHHDHGDHNHDHAGHRHG